MNQVYTSSNLKADMEKFVGNPNRIHQYILNLLESVSDGEHMVVDATNPFAFLLEAATSLSSATINRAESLTRKQYVTLANTFEDLYHHMSDLDYRGRFSSPSNTTISLMLGLDEVKLKAVEENEAGVSRLTIPRYTKFTVADIPFTLLYPIDIRVLKHGGLRITYDDDLLLQIKTLDTNIVDWSIITMDSQEWLKIDIPLYQLDMSRQIAQVNNLTGFRKEYQLPAPYYYCEAYNQVNGEWIRIKTTHSDKVYDPLVPTVQLKVINNTLRVDIPQVYLNNKTIKDAVRLDIYTTEGPLDMALSGYSAASFDANWSILPNNFISKFSAPLDTFSTMTIFSTHNVEGGSPAMSFTELRDRVITRTPNTEGLPITGQQLKDRLRDLGFNLVYNIDDVTDRQFLATKTIPPSKELDLVTGIGSSVQTLVVNLSHIRNYPHVYTYLSRTTILPEQLYSLDGGVLSILSENQQNDIMSIDTPEALTDIVNSRQLMFTPYYYVVDLSNNTVDCRIYDLDAPTVEARFFFESNLTIGAKFDIIDYRVQPNENNGGYVLEIMTELGKSLKDYPAEYLDIQLSFKGVRQNNRNHIKATLVNQVDENGIIIGDTQIWRFNIETFYDINAKDEMLLVPFYTPVNLMHEFDVVAVLKTAIPSTYKPSAIDEIVDNAVLYNGDWVGVTQEKITIKFGERLQRLYNRTRTITDHTAIRVRTNDEPLIYSRDVYEFDETGTLVFSYNPTTLEVIPTVLHEAGDTVKDEFGNTMYRWRVGDLILDERGDPIYTDGGVGLLREIDLVLFDAKYYFSTDSSTKKYVREVVGMINNWVNKDMVRLNGQLLERSEIFFQPTITKGNIKVKADNNKLISVDAQQELMVTFFMVQDKYNDAILRNTIAKSTIKTLHEGLAGSTVSKDALLKRVRETIGDDIVSVDIEGFLHDEWRACTVLDPAQRLSYAKRLVALTNGEITVEDAVDVRFLLHST